VSIFHFKNHHLFKHTSKMTTIWWFFSTLKSRFQKNHTNLMIFKYFLILKISIPMHWNNRKLTYSHAGCHLMTCSRLNNEWISPDDKHNTHIKDLLENWKFNSDCLFLPTFYSIYLTTFFFVLSFIPFSQIVRPINAFLVVDVQNDFISGSLNISNCAAQQNGIEVSGKKLNTIDIFFPSGHERKIKVSLKCEIDWWMI
jgi:hypothetical protein